MICHVIELGCPVKPANIQSVAEARWLNGAAPTQGGATMDASAAVIAGTTGRRRRSDPGRAQGPSLLPHGGGKGGTRASPAPGAAPAPTQRRHIPHRLTGGTHD